ncbi:hypothetical protein L1987_45808 [Smallanthus sonchifolius]|uniref:Uncharacterized protein n=1 Tax=Smallanthus sonchifolius TaxID=185202 RepID=A0ACB9FXW5_9ASTR|nr:hypothetical protein L1987_45808 [Smallanthus sonchifolius]
MKRERKGEVWDFEHELPGGSGGGGQKLILGLDGGTTKTICVCMPIIPSTPNHSPPVYARAVAGCSNHNSVGGYVFLVLIISDIFPNDVEYYVENDAVAALASGTMGKLHGCVLIAGTGTIAYGYTKDGREARASGAEAILGDWGSGYGIAAKAVTSVIRAYDGRGPETMLTCSTLHELQLSSPDELIGWTYADPSWARVATLVPVVVSCAEAGDQVANDILLHAVQELASSVKAVVHRLGLCGKDGKDSFPLVMVGNVLEANKRWDIGKEVIGCISKDFPGTRLVRAKVEPAVGAALLAWNYLIEQYQQELSGVDYN